MREDAGGEKGSWPLLAGIALVCFGLVALEIAASRLLSVLLSHHFVFLVLSVALLGLGLGGMWVRLRRPSAPAQVHWFLAGMAALLAVSMPAVVLLATGASGWGGGPLVPVCHGLILLVPFVLAGAILAEVYRSFPGMSGRTYGADLLGGGAGAGASVVLMDALGGVGAPLLLAAMVSLAAPLFAVGAKARRREALGPALGAPLLTVGLFAAHWGGIWSPAVPVGRDPSKEIHDALTTFKGRIVETRWSAFGRTDMVAFHEHPDHRDIYLDGTAGSPMYRFSGDMRSPGAAVSRLKETFPGYLPLQHLGEDGKDNALVIGPGGGRDVLLALMAGLRRVVAAEVNEDLVHMVRAHGHYNGGIYGEHPHIQVFVDEGRGFLRRRAEAFDLIYLSLPVTNTSRSPEGYSLTENFLFTRESMLEYLDHLTPEGRLVVVGHNDAEALRLLATCLAALRARGVAIPAAMAHVGLLGSEDYPVFILKREPFTRAESLEILDTLRERGQPISSSFLPRLGPPSGLNPGLLALEAGQMDIRQLVDRAARQGFDIRPVWDDAPFFYKVEAGVPRVVSLVLWPSLAILGLILVPAALERTPGNGKGPRAPKDARRGEGALPEFLLLFAVLGMGFMIIEVSLAQRLSLFLGHPVVSLVFILTALLIPAGLGSVWSGRLGEARMGRGIRLAVAAAAAMALGHAFLVPGLLGALMGMELPARMAVAAALVAPLGFALGIPFPLGIRLLGRAGLGARIPWMWCVNGVGSVVGSGAAVMLAIQWGFSAALTVAAMCYLVMAGGFRGRWGQGQ